MSTITDLDVLDIRFPTSRDLDGSDAMNPDPDYSAAYVILRTDDADGLTGHGLTFTIGRGTEVVVAAVRALAPLVVGRSTDELFPGMGAFWRSLVGDSQLRWIGPEKGAIHLATAAVVNAVWDLRAKRAGKPLWELLTTMTPAEIVELVDFRYLTDALTPDEALEILEELAPTREARIDDLLRDGYPAYTTSVGWLGYSDDKIRTLCQAALADGWTRFKMKVGSDVDDDLRRIEIVREEIGPEMMLAVDANQRLDGPARAVRPVLDRGADEPGRHPRPRGDRPRRRPDPGRDRGARSQPGDVQAAVPGRCDRRLPDRRLPARWGQRGGGGASAGGEVRRPGLPACRWCRAV